MKNIIYYRRSLFSKEELTAAQKYFECVNLLTNIPQHSFVIPRYSLYPFASDQEKEILNLNCQLINSHQQHLYIADLQNYVLDLQGFTPRTWNNLVDLPENTAFILKGETNSKKSYWNTSMFAANKQEAIKVHSKLCEDNLIGSQNIYIREYIPLVKYFDGIGGIPITKEFRFFVAYGKILCGDYYWQNYIDEFEIKPNVSEVPQDFLNKVIDKVGDNSNFFVIDVAQTQNGNWIVIELNDGSQSGLSCNDPEILYKNLFNVLKEKNNV